MDSTLNLIVKTLKITSLENVILLLGILITPRYCVIRRLSGTMTNLARSKLFNRGMEMTLDMRVTLSIVRSNSKAIIDILNNNSVSSWSISALIKNILFLVRYF